MTDTKRCELCGSLVKVVGTTTQHYVPATDLVLFVDQVIDTHASFNEEEELWTAVMDGHYKVRIQGRVTDLHLKAGDRLPYVNFAWRRHS